MRAAKMDRVKRRLLRQAVADNIDTIRGLPPRAVRPAYRTLRLWLRRTPLLLLFLTLAGSTYLASDPTPARDTFTPAKIVLTRRAATASLGAADAIPVDSAAFPLSVRRVVIDAGHGGNDPGATSMQHLTEKEVTLDVAPRLKALLTQKGVDVVVTRRDDRLI